jgi:hypothetical protein
LNEDEETDVDHGAPADEAADESHELHDGDDAGNNLASDEDADLGTDADDNFAGDYNEKSGADIESDAGINLNSESVNSPAADAESVDTNADGEDLNGETASEADGEFSDSIDAADEIQSDADAPDIQSVESIGKGLEELDNFKVEDDNNEEPSDVDAEKAFDENPFNEDGSLKQNIEYSTGEYDYRYETDGNGRICGFETDSLHLTERENRLPHNGQTPDKGEFDDAGHLFGDRFGGSPELDNWVSQDSHINRSDYKSMENEWADALHKGSHVEVSGDVGYEGDSHRPSSFDVFYSIDGEVYEKSFANRRE